LFEEFFVFRRRSGLRGIGTGWMLHIDLFLRGVYNPVVGF
jgi:hypothetical protein